jgi:hypothetical protein
MILVVIVDAATVASLVVGIVVGGTVVYKSTIQLSEFEPTFRTPLEAATRPLHAI